MPLDFRSSNSCRHVATHEQQDVIAVPRGNCGLRDARSYEVVQLEAPVSEQVAPEPVGALIYMPHSSLSRRGGGKQHGRRVGRKRLYELCRRLAGQMFGHFQALRHVERAVQPNRRGQVGSGQMLAGRKPWPVDAMRISRTVYSPRCEPSASAAAEVRNRTNRKFASEQRHHDTRPAYSVAVCVSVKGRIVCQPNRSCR